MFALAAPGKADIAIVGFDVRYDPTRIWSEFHTPRFRGLARECELTEINIVCLLMLPAVNPEGGSDAHSGFGDFDGRHGFDGSADSGPDL
jgi:hypothetical protein